MNKDKTNNRSFFEIEIKQRLKIYIKYLAFFVFILSIFFISLATLELLIYLKPIYKIIFVSSFLLLLLFLIIITIKRFKPLYNSKFALNNQLGKELKELFINTYQLIKSTKSGSYSSLLTHKAVEERTEKITNITNSNTYKKSFNRKYFRFLIMFFMAIIFFSLPFFVKPYKNAVERIFDVNTVYSKPLPYIVKIENTKLSAYKNESFKLIVTVEGDELPAELYIISNNTKTKLKKETNNKYIYEFDNLIKDTEFQIVNEDYKSIVYKIKLIEKPKILHYKINATYPIYTGKANEVFENQSNIIIPQGTKLDFVFITEGIDNIVSTFDNKNNKIQIINNIGKISYYVNNQIDILFLGNNNRLQLNDSVIIQCNVINDNYPQLKLDIIQDSIYENIIYFNGEASDDYGISNVIINYSIYDNEEKEIKSNIKVPFILNYTQISINEILNLENIYIEKPRRIELYLDIYDNDKVNGNKKISSAKKVIVFKTEQEKEIAQNLKNDENISNIKSLVTDAINIEKEIEKIKKNIQLNATKDWKTNKNLEALKDKVSELKKKIEDLNKEIRNINNQENNENKKKIENDIKENLQKELDLMMKSLEQMLKENQMKDIQKKLDDIKEQNKFVKENIEKNLEQYKNLEFEKRFEQNLSKLNDIIQKQNKLNEKPINKDNKAEISKEQDNINKDFEQFNKDMDNLRDLNNKLEESNKLIDTKKEEENIKQNLKQATDNLDKNKTSKAKENQKSAKSKMDDLKESLEKNKEEIEEDNIAEDIDDVRHILENLIRHSFNQEQLMKEFSFTKPIDPNVTKIIKEQVGLKDNFEIIKDSLNAIAKRQPEVQSFIFKEIHSITQNYQKISDAMFDKKMNEILVFQRYIMTSTNNLALMLAESLKKMKDKQSEMKSKSKSKKPSNSTCNNPGNSKSKKDKKGPNIEKIRKQQEELNKKIEKKGQNIGKKNSGSEGQGENEELARLAAQQEAIRRMLQQYLDDIKKNGEISDGKLEKMMSEMEKTEKEIVNKNINKNTLKRQQDITTRLLESEKALMEREKEDKRESKEAKQIISNSAQYLDLLKKSKKNQQEILKRVPLSLKFYYKDKVSKYFLKFEEK